MPSVLVDSNVLLRLAQPAHAHHPVASAAVASLRKQNFELCIARQNLVEFWVVATRPLANNGMEMNPVPVAGEIRKLRSLFRLLEGTPGITDAWENLVRQHLVLGKQAHDAHLVAAMVVHGVRRLLTFNGDDFQRYAFVEVITPTSAAAAKP